eukprot:gene20784-49929_t
MGPNKMGPKGTRPTPQRTATKHDDRDIQQHRAQQRAAAGHGDDGGEADAPVSPLGGRQFTQFSQLGGDETAPLRLRQQDDAVPARPVTQLPTTLLRRAAMSLGAALEPSPTHAAPRRVSSVAPVVRILAAHAAARAASQESAEGESPQIHPQTGGPDRSDSFAERSRRSAGVWN